MNNQQYKQCANLINWFTFLVLIPLAAYSALSKPDELELLLPDTNPTHALLFLASCINLQFFAFALLSKVDD